jgi:tryptophan synthase alpha chain
MRKKRTIAGTFEMLREKNEIALITYTTAGFPSLSKSMDIIRQLDEYGADIIELGLPFSDPVADGPMIQYASQCALDAGVTVRDAIERLKDIDIASPLVLMSYANPIFAYGMKEFFRDVADVGIRGVIIPDLPVEEGEDWRDLANVHQIKMIFLVAPTSTSERIEQIARSSEGFIYCVSITGTTGLRKELAPDLAKFIVQLKQCTDKPIAVGFGISSATHIQTLRNKVDGVIIGSRIIKAIKNKENLKNLIQDFKKATRR